MGPESRRQFLRRLATLGASAAGFPVLASCANLRPRSPQQAKVPRIGYLASGGPLPNDFSRAFLDGLHDLGYVEGRNILIEYRLAEGNDERLPGLALELVQLNVDVILATGNPAAVAAKRATSSIPIVVGASGGPVEAGLVASMARPGGNVTGLSLLAPQLAAKRLELLKQAVPNATSIAVLTDRLAATGAGEAAWEETQAAAWVLGLQLNLLEVSRPSELEAAFEAAIRERADAVCLLPAVLFTREQARLGMLSTKHGLPAIYQSREFATAGGLLAYGPNLPAMYRRSAGYVDKILKGALPGDLPVEWPTRFDFVINLKTAHALALTIPPSVLEQATEVIQ